MKKYNRHSLALSDEEEADFQKVKEHTGFGITKIFKAMVNALKIDIPESHEALNEEEI